MHGRGPFFVFAGPSRLEEAPPGKGAGVGTGTSGTPRAVPAADTTVLTHFAPFKKKMDLGACWAGQSHSWPDQRTCCCISLCQPHDYHLAALAAAEDDDFDAHHGTPQAVKASVDRGRDSTTTHTGDPHTRRSRTRRFWRKICVRCALDCNCPLSFAEGGAFILGFGLGVVAQSRRRVAVQGGAQGGKRPRPSDFCAVAGRERAPGPARRAK
jgi:hypothetical protein